MALFLKVIAKWSCQKKSKLVRILAFDPGYGRLGWGAVSNDSNSHKQSAFSLAPNTSLNIIKPTNALQLIAYGVLETPSNHAMSSRMHALQKQIGEIVKELQPEYIFMERLHFSKNQTTVAGVYQAQGLILAAAGSIDLDVKELAPTTIKQALTGSGRAAKKQLMLVVCRVLNLSEQIQPDDAADAVAVAIAGWFVLQSKIKMEDFLVHNSPF